MKLHSGPQQHLTYCLNIHPGESWAENLQAIQTHALLVKQALSPEKPFGLGLRLGCEAARDLSQDGVLEAFQATLHQLGMYVFTVNGFPYGLFHGLRVKEQVYAPDWTTEARKAYTIQLIDILARLLPEQTAGSISTVPISFKAWARGEAEVKRAVGMLSEIVHHLHRLEQEKGIYIHIGLEPEPSCFLETTAETIAFFKEVLWLEGVNALARDRGCNRARAESMWRRYIGMCFDCCHLAIQYESLEHSLDCLLAEGILISKVHLSAALIGKGPDPRAALRPFEEPVYLHQVKVRHADGHLSGWEDLPDALAEAPLAEAEEWRVHFHVPLFWEGTEALGSTVQDLTPGFFKKLRPQTCAHLETETYTFDVLPEALRSGSVAESIIRELSWARERL